MRGPYRIRFAYKPLSELGRNRAKGEMAERVTTVRQMFKQTLCSTLLALVLIDALSIFHRHITMWHAFYLQISQS